MGWYCSDNADSGFCVASHIEAVSLSIAAGGLSFIMIIYLLFSVSFFLSIESFDNANYR